MKHETQKQYYQRKYEETQDEAYLKMLENLKERG
tara:strand:+ start:723 stop:824 length:102 start_codon:yes stop_codon:yes gene_type:complete